MKSNRRIHLLVLHTCLATTVGGAVQIGPAICFDDIEVVNGNFAPELYFGQPFSGGAEGHLEFESHQNNASGCSDPNCFTVLAPWKSLTSAFCNELQVAKEPTPPEETHSLEGKSDTYLTQLPDDATAERLGSLGFAAESTTDLAGANEGADERLALVGAGNSRFVAGTHERLRIVRGTVGPLGEIIAGSGFTANHIDSGFYHIRFDPPFAEEPTITATLGQASSTFVPTLILGANLSRNDFSLHVFATLSSTVTPDWEFSFIAVGPR